VSKPFRRAVLRFKLELAKSRRNSLRKDLARRGYAPSHGDLNLGETTELRQAYWDENRKVKRYAHQIVNL